MEMFRSIALSLGHNTNLDWRPMRKINAWCWIVLFPFFNENIDSFMHILCCLPHSSSPLIICEYIILPDYGCPRKMVPTAVLMNVICDSRSFSPVCLSWSGNLITQVYQMNHKGYLPEGWWQEPNEGLERQAVFIHQTRGCLRGREAILFQPEDKGKTQKSKRNPQMIANNCKERVWDTWPALTEIPPTSASGVLGLKAPE